jgi:putative protease
LDKIELLAPAGDFERLKVAIAFGADAVYLGGTSFGLRAKAKNFDMEQMREAVEYAHFRGVKVFVTANVFARNEDFAEMGEYFRQLAAMGVDALIISDPGVFATARRFVPDMEIHISTQANNTNYNSALFWANLGAARVVLARELSIIEICDIYQKVEGKILLEAFVHGSMCIAYSGRCLLSAYFAHRDSNRGHCAHVCRYRFALGEERRTGEFFPIQEDENGAFILNSKDLCMIEHIPELVNSGLASLKIEGRMKTPHYVATVVKAYREAIDDFYAEPARYEAKKARYLAELLKSSNREFSTGFYFGNPGEGGQIYHGDGYVKTYDFLGIVRDFDAASGMATLEQRSKFAQGDKVEFLRAGRANFSQEIKLLTDADGNIVNSAPHAQQILKIKVDEPVSPFDILRGEVKTGNSRNRDGYCGD